MFCKLPDLSSGFAKLKILLYLEEHFRNDHTLIGLTVMNALKHRTPGEEIIHTLKSQIKDNPDLLKRVLGEKLFGLISEY